MRRWWIVVVYAIAMAWVEAAVVYDLRLMADRVVPYQANPMPIEGRLAEVEVVREAATLVMLLTVGMLAGRTWRARLGYSAIAFGVWDIFYYVFLRLICGWPASLLDWDILFLLPLPWWGPVLAPVCIAFLMIIWGTLVSQPRRHSRGAGAVYASCATGIALALYVFMADAIAVAPRGADAVRNVLPTTFNWTLFAVALALMSAPVARLAWRTPAVSGAPTRL
jgi:hypothetical protein